MRQVLPETAQITPAGCLVVGGFDVNELADRFGTPLIVFDRATFESRAHQYTSVLGNKNVFYAGKAFLCVAVCELLETLDMGLDVCTGGEVATALAAGFNPARLIFHGNNKSSVELTMARDAGVGRIVIDSFEEIELLAQIGAKTRLLVRVTPGVEAHTHEFVQTGQEDSKFGFGLADGIALEAIKRAGEIPGCELVGLHAHIGSQIFEMTAFDLAVRRLTDFLITARDQLGFTTAELNLGGGLGIAHTEDELSPNIAESAQRLKAAVTREFSAVGLPLPDVFAEPGRSIVGPAAVTLYRVGTVKRIPGVRTYVSVDGGMADNIRPALYGARYEAFLANRAAPPGPRVTVVGKHCESGDVLIKDVHLPDDVAPGDVLCIPATGAYTYSMAGNYNHVPRPAVIMVDRGKAVEIVSRESHIDLIRLDRHLDGAPL